MSKRQIHRSGLIKLINQELQESTDSDPYSLVHQCEVLDLVKIESKKPGIADPTDWITLTNKGFEILQNGGYKKWSEDIQSQKNKEQEKLEIDLWIAKQTKRWFWMGTIIGFIGGILGIISFFYQ